MNGEEGEIGGGTGPEESNVGVGDDRAHDAAREHQSKKTMYILLIILEESGRESAFGEDTGTWEFWDSDLGSQKHVASNGRAALLQKDQNIIKRI